MTIVMETLYEYTNRMLLVILDPAKTFHYSIRRVHNVIEAGTRLCTHAIAPLLKHINTEY